MAAVTPLVNRSHTGTLYNYVNTKVGSWHRSRMKSLKPFVNPSNSSTLEYRVVDNQSIQYASNSLYWLPDLAYCIVLSILTMLALVYYNSSWHNYGCEDVVHRNLHGILHPTRSRSFLIGSSEERDDPSSALVDRRSRYSVVTNYPFVSRREGLNRVYTSNGGSPGRHPLIKRDSRGRATKA